jgi:hypothetical protein
MLALVTAVGFSPGAAAQTPSPAPPTCSLVTADEVAAAFDVTTVSLSTWSSTYDCEFEGDVSIDVSIEPSAGLDEAKADYPEGRDLTIGGSPAWYASGEGAGQLWVAAGEILLSLDPWSVDVPDDMTHEALQAALTGLAELILPRLPAGPDADAAARIRDLIPDTLGGEPVTVQVAGGEMILGSADTTDPGWIAFASAIEAQGADPSTLLIAIGATGSGETNVIVATVPGTDAAGLLEPFLGLIAPGTPASDMTTAEVGGKQVRVIPLDPSIYAYAVGDLVVVAGGDDATMAELFAALP